MDTAPHSKAAPHLAMFINMLSLGSLMMVMPLGPDFVHHLDMSASHVGYVSGGATLAAACSAALSAAWLDRLDRKRALLILLALRFALLLACALAETSLQLIGLFVLAGLVSGPLSAILMATMLDLVPPTERGRTLAYVGMGFPLAAILIVPLALELAMRWGWQGPFVVFGAAGLALAGLCQWLFPAPRGHATASGSIRTLLASPLCQGALAIIALQLFGHFLLVPHFSHYFQFNLGFPRKHIGLLYLCGGLASLAAMRLGGTWLDRGSAASVVLISSGLLAVVTVAGFAAPVGLPVYLAFSLFMALSAVRSNSTLTIAAAIPPPHQRATFMAFQGTVSNIAAGLGSLFSAASLGTGAHGELLGFDRLAWLYAIAGALAGLGVTRLLHGIRQRDSTATQTTTPRQAI